VAPCVPEWFRRLRPTRVGCSEQQLRLRPPQRAGVYVASDSSDVRDGAHEALGSSFMPPPSYLAASIPQTLDEVSLAPRRNTSQRDAAFTELLLLARADAIVVKDLSTSTFSSVAGAWFAHRAAGADGLKPGLGVFLADRRCERIPPGEVEAMMDGKARYRIKRNNTR